MKFVYASALFALVGCNWFDTPPRPDAGPPPPPPVDLGPEDGGPPGPPVTRVYVINYLRVPVPDASLMTIDGLDIDGTSATVCGQMDYTATWDLGGGMGVDNMLGQFLAFLANPATQEHVDAGDNVLLVEVTDINNFVDDPSVGVTFYVGKLQAGVVPLRVGACAMEPPDPPIDPTCRLAAGQTFDIDGSSFSDGALGLRPRFTFPNAAIVQRHLRAGPADIPLTIDLDLSPSPPSRVPAALLIHGARIDFRLTDTAITRGVLGGALNDAELLSMMVGDPQLCRYVTTFQPVLGSFSDLTPMSVGPCTYSATDGGAGPGAHHCPPNSMCDVGTMTCMSCADVSIGVDMNGVLAAKGNIVATPPIDAGPLPPDCVLDGGAPG